MWVICGGSAGCPHLPPLSQGTVRPGRNVGYARARPMTLLSPEIESALKALGISTGVKVLAVDCAAAHPILEALAGETSVVAATTVVDAVKQARSLRLAAVVSNPELAAAVVRGLAAENLTIGVLALSAAGDGSASAILRAGGVMDVLPDLSEIAVVAPLRRALDCSALLALELAHRCESRRLLNRELDLLGQPPESMSDDLLGVQPPPLPVGPLSVYNLDEASESFETAYIERVQQLCASSREAALYLGVSSATLSRRTRRESALDDA